MSEVEVLKLLGPQLKAAGTEITLRSLPGMDGVIRGWALPTQRKPSGAGEAEIVLFQERMGLSRVTEWEPGGEGQGGLSPDLHKARLSF